LTSVSPWQEVWEEARETRVKIKRAIAKMMLRELTGAFERWTEMAFEAKELRVKMARVIGKLKNRQIAGAFSRWAEMTEESLALKRKMKKALGRAVQGSFQAHSRGPQMPILAVLVPIIGRQVCIIGLQQGCIRAGAGLALGSIKPVLKAPMGPGLETEI